MFVPILNILIGAGLAVGGLTGKLALFGTSSPTAAAVVGGAIALFGAVQLVRAMRERD